MAWHSLESLSELEQLVGSSQKNDNTVAIFKHSTRCAISSMAKSRLEKSWQKVNADIPIYILNLIEHRDISDKIAEHFNVPHQSPQLILVKSGNAVYNASHISISSKAAAKYI
ncbi:MAG: bacillithiol system redox-active protein YtxJ [Vicingaceae bacterium]